MKKLFTVLTLLLVNSVLSAIVPPTVPQKMSYQAVIRNNSNVLVTNQQVGMKTSILQGSATGTAVYVEIYNPNYITNANGLVTVEIGGGIPLTGTFSSINWATGPYFIKTEVDPTGGTSYTITAISELLSVPYALHAKTAQTADYNSLSNLPIFATVATTGSYNDLINKPLLPVPGGVTGNVQFNNAGVLGGDANFKWDNANKRLGIGISIPSYQLQVMGDNLRAIHGETSHSSGAAIFGVGNSSSGSNVGVRGTSNSTNGTGIWGDATASTGTTYAVKGIVTSTNGFSGYFTGGKFYVQGNVGIGTTSPGSKLDVDGTVNIGGGNASELNRDQTTTANLVPIAYGCVSAAGTIHTVGSTTNFTIIKTGTGVYEINISGLIFTYYNFTVCATLIGPGPAFIVTGSGNDHVTVNTYNSSGSAENKAFYFVVYKP